MNGGRCVANPKPDDSALQMEAAKQIAALKNIQKEAEMRQLQVEHDNKIGDLERRVLQLGRVEASDVDTKQDVDIKDLEDQVLKVEDVTAELTKRASDTNDLLKELAANRPIPIPPALPPLELPSLPVVPPPSRSATLHPISSGKRLATIVPKSEVNPMQIEPLDYTTSPPAPPQEAQELDVSKYSIAHISS